MRWKMGYTIRRWLSYDGNLDDDTMRVTTADDAIIAAIKLAGIFQNVITDDIKNQIRTMIPGETVAIRRSSLHLTIRIRRTKT